MYIHIHIHICLFIGTLSVSARVCVCVCLAMRGISPSSRPNEGDQIEAAVLCVLGGPLYSWQGCDVHNATVHIAAKVFVRFIPVWDAVPR